MAAHRVGSLLGKVADEPTLLEFAKECVLNQAAQAIQVQHGQSVGDGQTGQKDFRLIWRVEVLLKLRHYDGIQGIAFKVGAVGALLMSFVAVLVIGGQAGNPDQFDVAGLKWPLAEPFGGDDQLPIRFFFQKGAGVRLDMHAVFGGDDKIHTVPVLDLP